MSRSVVPIKEKEVQTQEQQVQVVSENQIIISLLQQILEEMKAYRLPMPEENEAKEQ